MSLWQFFKLPQHQASQRLQAQLDAVQNGAGSSKEAFTPAPSGVDSGVATTPNKTASAAKTKPKKPPVGTGYPETQAAKDARLRRACERKPSGRIKVPEAVHEKWRTGSRPKLHELMDVLASCDWDQDL